MRALVGYNPFRKHLTTTADYGLVAVAFLLTLVLVLWAFGVL